MRRTKRFLLAFLLLAIMSCDKTSQPHQESQKHSSAKFSNELPAPPSTDFSSPEKSLYSYQSMLNYNSANWSHLFNKSKEDEQKYFSTAFSIQANEIMNNNRQIESIKFATEYDFSIKEMKKETDSRVVAFVTIRNTTPFLPGIEIHENIKELRELGTQFKFVLELDKAKWCIAGIYKWDLKKADWSEKIVKKSPKTEADYLDSLIWIP